MRPIVPHHHHLCFHVPRAANTPRLRTLNTRLIYVCACITKAIAGRVQVALLQAVFTCPFRRAAAGPHLFPRTFGGFYDAINRRRAVSRSVALWP